LRALFLHCFAGDFLLAVINGRVTGVSACLLPLQMLKLDWIFLRCQIRYKGSNFLTKVLLIATVCPLLFRVECIGMNQTCHNPAKPAYKSYRRNINIAGVHGSGRGGGTSH
jgi:hypothetical protein